MICPLDRLLGLLRPSWSLLEHSWRPLGVSWGALGGVLGPLGRLLGHLEGDPKQHKNNMSKKTDFEPHMGPTTLIFGAPKEDPKSTKIGPKTSPNLRRFSRPKKLRFKSLLEPSWADLGAFWRPSWGPKNRSGIGRRSIW